MGRSCRRSCRRTRQESRTESRLLVSIVSNMGLLAFFKYTGFAAENLNALSHFLGSAPNLCRCFRSLFRSEFRSTRSSR